MTTPNIEPITGPGISWAMEQIGKRFNPSMKKESSEQSTGETQNDSTLRSKPTPGPWRVDDTSLQFAIAIRPGKTGYLLASLGRDNMLYREDGQDINANARLIAAAPDLLDNLRSIVASLEIRLAPKRSDREAWFILDCARAAIAKAEGRAE